MYHNRLLVVDDQPDICAFVKRVAEKHGYDVVVSHNGDEFRSAYRDHRPTVITLDLRIPGEDGVQLLRHLARQKFEGHIVLVSGLDTKVLETAAHLAREYGLRLLGTIQKPSLLPELEGVLRKVRNTTIGSVTKEELERAIASGQIIPYYQPKIDITSAQPVIDSVEALARWQHPNLGLVPPDEFIPMAEETGLIGPLTDVILTAALGQAREWQKSGLSVPVAVNCSPALLSNTQFPDQIWELAHRHRIPLDLLTLEITESGVTADKKHCMEVLARLRLKSINLSIDDFGSGCSSLAQLHRLPFGEVKIDKSFVLDMPKNETSRAIVRSVVDLAHKLGLSACAEGVETAETLSLLRSFGCEKAQGCFFSPPMPKKEMTELLRKSRGKRASKIEISWLCRRRERRARAA